MISMPEDDFRRNVVDRLNAQDAAIKENTDLTKSIAADTSFMREAWKDGIATVRFFCRLAAAWRFLLRQVVVPVGLPLLFIYALIYYANHGTVPNVVAEFYKLIKILL
ncbi:hypothetical protein AB4Y32_15865 [Paraburkholderia phymatum]|uniref:Uncharacterized protein n=1 Tax=Paraburkholderia phymatum TaxID=148447 RepID=A0ACC6U171_9BURK